MNITLHIVPSLSCSAKFGFFRQEQRAITIVMYIGALMRSGAGSPLTSCQSVIKIEHQYHQAPRANLTLDSEVLCCVAADDADENQARALKRPRLVWTAKLHQCFVQAVERLGLKNAVPKTIMQARTHRPGLYIERGLPKGKKPVQPSYTVWHSQDNPTATPHCNLCEQCNKTGLCLYGLLTNRPPSFSRP